MSRRRRSFLGRDDALPTPNKMIEPTLPTPYVPPEPEPPKEEEDALRETDLALDLQLPESMEEQIPGFFEWDGGDGLDEPPTEEVPAHPIDTWTDEFSAPLVVPEAPPMDGILDGASRPPAPGRAAEALPETEYDNFEDLFELPPPPKKPRNGGLQTRRLVFALTFAIVLGLGVGGALALVIYWKQLQDVPAPPAKPETVPIKMDMRRRSSIEPPPQTPPVQRPEPLKEANTPPSASAESPKKKARMGTVKVRLQGSSAADIWVDGSLFGMAPINVALSPGRHTISAVPHGREGEKMNREVLVTAGETMDVEFSY